MKKTGLKISLLDIFSFVSAQLIIPSFSKKKKKVYVVINNQLQFVEKSLVFFIFFRRNSYFPFNNNCKQRHQQYRLPQCPGLQLELHGPAHQGYLHTGIQVRLTRDTRDRPTKISTHRDLGETNWRQTKKDIYTPGFR